MVAGERTQDEVRKVRPAFSELMFGGAKLRGAQAPYAFFWA